MPTSKRRPVAEAFRQGATLVPRMLCLVERASRAARHEPFGAARAEPPHLPRPRRKQRKFPRPSPCRRAPNSSARGASSARRSPKPVSPSAWICSWPSFSTLRSEDVGRVSAELAKPRGVRAIWHRLPSVSRARNECGCSSMVEQQPSKLMTRVRFPSPAPSLSGFVK
jgi:hypothetical protein